MTTGILWEELKELEFLGYEALVDRFQKVEYEKNPGHGKRRIVESRAAKYQLIATI